MSAAAVVGQKFEKCLSKFAQTSIEEPWGSGGGGGAGEGNNNTSLCSHFSVNGGMK
jgi:hypothetical protein